MPEKQILAKDDLIWPFDCFQLIWHSRYDFLSGQKGDMVNTFFKRVIYTIITLGLFGGLSMPVYELKDLDKYHLKGKVKSVMEIKYALAEDGGQAGKDKILFHKYTSFDNFGYETETIIYVNSEVFLKSEYLFGADGKQREMNETNADGTPNMNVTYKYDEKGFRTEANYNWADNRKIGEIAEHTDYYFEIIQNDIFTKVLYKNEYRGYCTEENYLRADSSLSFKIVAKYDFRGNKLESGYYHGNGRLSWMTKYKYDRYDNLIESRVYKSNRIAVFSSYKYQFDGMGNWVVRNEKREVHVNILTAGLERANTITERTIAYY
jgi:hypothetical protein